MLVVIAEKEELKLVEELGYSDYPVLITGVGGVNVIKALKNLSKDTPIINIGYCGSNNIKIGEKVIVKDVFTNHKVAKFNEQDTDCVITERYKQVSCYTATDFVNETDKTDDCIFDMELAFIRAMFEFVVSIKVVSDNLDKKQYDKTTK